MNTPLIVIGGLVLFFALEQLFPLRRTTTALVGRVILNFIISGLAFAVAWVLVKPAALHTLNLAADNSFGLLHVMPMPAWIQWVLAFLLLDLSFYYWHVLNHRVPFLWRFHNVHHFDPDLDVSTGFRFHFGEVAMSAVFRVAQVALIGPTLEQFLAYELVFQLHTLFEHSNWRLPKKLDDALRLVVVTPRMHGIHHSQYRDETNSNYSVVFSFWDRLHKTLCVNVPQEKIVVGVPGYSSAENNRVWPALAAPFRKQKEYWPEENVTRRD